MTGECQLTAAVAGGFEQLRKQLHLEFARLLRRTSQLKWNCRMSEDELASLAALQLQLAATRASPATSPPNPRPTKSH